MPYALCATLAAGRAGGGTLSCQGSIFLIRNRQDGEKERYEDESEVGD
jgi:hypothetical protein